jgi:hypothetical protein
MLFNSDFAGLKPKSRKAKKLLKDVAKATAEPATTSNMFEGGACSSSPLFFIYLPLDLIS